MHGETSTGCLNELSIFTDYKTHSHPECTLALDCVSSFGALPFSLKNVDFASATSGKALGALAGLSMVFYHQALAMQAEQGTYCQLAYYDDQTPFTLPAYLLANVLAALTAYPQRYADLAQHLHTVLNHPLLQTHAIPTQHYPTAISYQLPAAWRQNAALNGLLLHQDSSYLQQRSWSQISTIQPDFDEDFAALDAWLQQQHLLT